jgi:hypothetical protein
VTFDGQTKSTTGTSLTFTVSNGTYAYTASAHGYNSPSGSVTVDGSAVTQAVTFT